MLKIRAARVQNPAGIESSTFQNPTPLPQFKSWITLHILVIFLKYLPTTQKINYMSDDLWSKFSPVVKTCRVEPAKEPHHVVWSHQQQLFILINFNMQCGLCVLSLHYFLFLLPSMNGMISRNRKLLYRHFKRSKFSVVIPMTVDCVNASPMNSQRNTPNAKYSMSML